MTIPEHIEKEAEELRDILCIEDKCAISLGCGCLMAISAALMAAEERGAARATERAAAIADQRTKAADDNGDFEGAFMAEDIAQAIRSK